VAEPFQDWSRPAALCVGRVRAPLAKSTSEPATIWDGLVTGHWSLVDRFDGDGRRHLLLRRNSPEDRTSRALTPRETSVVDYAVLGQSNKQMAYELGLSQSTVSDCLSRACARLGAITRAGLMQLVATKMVTYAGTDDHVMLSFPLLRPEIAAPAGLTASEQSVFHALLAGQSNAEIAASRGRSSHTIANQVAAIFRKLELSSRSELLATHAISASVHSFSVMPFSGSVSVGDQGIEKLRAEGFRKIPKAQSREGSFHGQRRQLCVFDVVVVRPRPPELATNAEE
jgi:DNA-binding NarL/FixJ family response regulator